MIIFDANDPLVLNGTYDREGWTPKERRAQARRATTPEEINMVKKKKPSVKKSARAFKTKGRQSARAVRSHRVNTIKGNGALPASVEVAPPDDTMTIGEAMRLAVEELGDVKIDADLAPAQMRELAEAYEQVAREQAAFTKKAEAAKIAKKSLEGATALLLEKVRLFTHDWSLPLFDHAQAELDMARMTSDPNPDEEPIAEAGEDGASA